MCEVPRVAVVYSGSTEYFPGMASKFFFKPSVTIPVAQIIIGFITHFMFYVLLVLLLFTLGYSICTLSNYTLEMRNDFCAFVCFL